MGIIISPAYALTLAQANEGWKPIIGWQNVVTAANLTATSETTNYPVSNLGNQATNLLWKSAVITDQYVTSLFPSVDKLDYIGLARHNLGSNGTSVTAQGLPIGGNAAVDGDWVELVPAQILANDAPALFRFSPEYYIGIRLKLTGISVAPEAGVLFAGALLTLARGLPVGHTPISYGRTTKKLAPRAQNGDYLGQVLMTAGLKSKIEQQDVDPAWYRANLEPFRAASPGQTFFWGWSPQDYPAEVGYCWVTNDPAPTINRVTGEIDVTFDIGGLAI